VHEGCLPCDDSGSFTGTLIVFVICVTILVAAGFLVVFSERLLGVDVRQLPLWLACTEPARLKIIW
jgi:hypothetical protein